MWPTVIRNPESAPLGLLLAVLLGCSATGRAQTPPRPPDLADGVDKLATALAAAAPKAGETLLLGLSVNGIAQDGTIRAVRVATPAGLGLAVPQQGWDELHLRLPLLPPRIVDGETYVVLGSDDNWHWHIDEASQTLMIDAPAASFRGQRMDMDAPMARVTLPSLWGAFANYDVQWQRLGTPDASGSATNSAEAMLEAGLFTPQGPVSSTGLYNNENRFVRLDSQWLIDQPQRMTRISVGDSVTQPGAWGQALRFGGLQWGTDFSLRPGFLSFPLPTLRGEAALPSTVDVYVNNSQRLQGRLQPGPFDISDLPVVTGQGEIRTVVHDLLGREQVIVQPYYVSPGLLKPGLHSFSVELGAERDDYGIASDHYGPAMLIATDRLGINDHFTRELRAELLSAQQTLGASGTWLWPKFGTGNFSLAASHSRSEGAGWLAAIGLDRQAQDWSGSLQLRKASSDFVQAGQSTQPGSSTAPGLSMAAALGRSWQGQSLGMSYVRQPGAGASHLASINYGRDLGKAGYVGVFLLRDLGATASSTLAITWSFALGERTSSSVGLTRNRGSGQDTQQWQAQLQHNAPLGEGVGYQLSTQSGGHQMAQANWQGSSVVLNGGVARDNGAESLRAGASGGIGWMDGSVFASRHVDGGLALVQVADYADVRVRQDNQVVARTDSQGRALLSGLRGYQPNRVSVDASDLPYDAELQALEITLTPAGRSASRIEFPVSRSLAASFRITDAQGQPLQPGTVMQQEGGTRSFPVGLDGKGYVAGLSAPFTVLHAHWPGGECRFELHLPANAIDLPDLGDIICK